MVYGEIAVGLDADKYLLRKILPVANSLVAGCIKRYIPRKTNEGDPCTIHEGRCTEGFYSCDKIRTKAADGRIT